MIGLALFVGAVAFNFQMNSVNKQTSDVTLKNIEALATTGIETGLDCCWAGCWTGDPYDNNMIWCDDCMPTIGYVCCGSEDKCT